jgi:hypothetical protein
MTADLQMLRERDMGRMLKDSGKVLVLMVLGGVWGGNLI